MNLPSTLPVDVLIKAGLAAFWYKNCVISIPRSARSNTYWSANDKSLPASLNPSTACIPWDINALSLLTRSLCFIKYPPALSITSETP